jgi:hypothetical protein
MTYPALSSAVDYLHRRGVSVPGEVAALAKGQATKQAGYAAARADLWAAVYDGVTGFLNSSAQAGTYSRPVVAAVAQAYLETADIAYMDGGGSLPLDADTAAWVKAEMDAQFAYVDSMFQTLKQMRKEGDFDAIHEGFRRADGYANSLDILFNNVKTMAAGNKMLTFGGSDGKESCSDCRRYKGKRHRASWWVSHDAVPPNRGFECRGYRCEHRLYDDQGNEWSV